MIPALPTPTELLARLKTRLGDFVVAAWDGRDGEDLYKALARVYGTLAGQVAPKLLGAYIRRATGATRARTTLRVTWSETTDDGVSIQRGQLLFTTPWGARWRLLEDLVREAGPAGYVDVLVEAEWAGSEYLVAPGTITIVEIPDTASPTDSIAWGPDTTEDGKAEFLAVVANSGDPKGFLGRVTCTNAAVPTLGALGTLDLLAMERGLPRVEDESDTTLRARIRTLPDVVTPGAVLRASTAAYQAWMAERHPGEPVGTVVLWEPWNYGYAPGVGAIGVHPPARAHSFLVVVPAAPWATLGLAPSEGAIGIHPIGGGRDVSRAGLYAAIQAQIDQIRAGGIWGLVLEGLP